MQFEREERDALARLLEKQGLQALDPLAALDAFLPRALREVLGCCLCCRSCLAAQLCLSVVCVFWLPISGCLALH